MSPTPPSRGPSESADLRDDRALLDAHLAGDAEAFGELFRRHRERLWAVALRTTGHREDAADALQEALISAFRRAGTFRGEAQVSTWLHRIVVNACLDRMRRSQVRAADPLPDDLDEYAARGAGLAAPPGEDPVAAALASDRRTRLLAALGALPPEQTAALVLVDLEGYPVAEAAEVLEVPVGTVKSRCARGRARLSHVLRDLEPTPPAARDGTYGPGAASHPGPPPTSPPSAPEGGDQA